MLQYVNGFSCAINGEKEDFVINFVQNAPVIDAEGIQEETVIENVASLVMGKTVAENLLNALQEMLAAEDEEEDE